MFSSLLSSLLGLSRTSVALDQIFVVSVLDSRCKNTTTEHRHGMRPVKNPEVAPADASVQAVIGSPSKFD